MDYNDNLMLIVGDLSDAIRDLYETNGTECEDVFALVSTNDEEVA